MIGYNRIRLLGTFVDNLTMDETISIICESIKKNQQLHHTVVNAAKIAALQDNTALKRSVNEADLINVDGLAVVWASKILNKPLKERVAGIDLFTNLVAKAYENKQSIFLLGATQEVVEKVRDVFSEKYSPDVIAGFANGYFKEEDEAKIIQKIVDSKPQMLFVAMTSPKKEIFLHKHRKALNSVGFIMGVGGSFDVVSAKVKRAPLWMQKIGLEWFFRFIQDPDRLFKRSFIINAKFVFLVFKEKFNKR